MDTVKPPQVLHGPWPLPTLSQPMDDCGPFLLANAGNTNWWFTTFLQRRPSFLPFAVPRTKVVCSRSRSGIISRLLASQVLLLVPVLLPLLRWPGHTPNSSG